ncbi:MAG: peptidoglycan DD-metalloendopeptidase family protein [Bacteroidia bacterium]|nr:peptidoglycan DD-metalloendopeptidase family protein [Bacteroidia bacterium]
MPSKPKSKATRLVKKELKFVKREYKLLKRIFKKKKHAIWTASVGFGLIMLGWVAGHLNWELIFNKQTITAPIIVQPITYDRFEMPIDSFDLETISIRPNQLPSEILLERGVSLGTIDRMAKEFMYVFDLRKMKAGNRLNFYYSPDSLHQLKYMIYEKSVSQYVVYNFRDSLQVSLKQKEIITQVCYTEVVIKTNLWDALVAEGIPISMVVEIANVFQWMIDLTSLNKGDRFEFIYENQTINNESIGIGNLFAGKCLYGKRWFEAYQFEQNGTSSYFNEKGESLRRAFLKAPISLIHITSRFTNSRMHPILRIRRPHFGVDYAASTGTPVVSIGDGKVIEKGHNGGGGNTLKIRLNSTFTTGYMHLSRYGNGIAVGSAVKQGDVVGYVGSTGLSTGPHLDFRIWQNGKPVDPLKVESPPVEPVDPKLRTAYDSIVKVYRAEFERYKKEGLNSPDMF